MKDMLGSGPFKKKKSHLEMQVFLRSARKYSACCPELKLKIHIYSFWLQTTTQLYFLTEFG